MIGFVRKVQLTYVRAAHTNGHLITTHTALFWLNFPLNNAYLYPSCRNLKSGSGFNQSLWRSEFCKVFYHFLHSLFFLPCKYITFFLRKSTDECPPQLKTALYFVNSPMRTANISSVSVVIPSGPNGPAYKLMKYIN